MATALAIMVLLQPGGPYRRTPFGGVIPSLEKAWQGNRTYKRAVNYRCEKEPLGV